MSTTAAEPTQAFAARDWGMLYAEGGLWALGNTAFTNLRVGVTEKWCVQFPLTPGKQTWDQVKSFARGIALEFTRAAPKLFTATAAKASRCSRKPMAPCVFFTRHARGRARSPTRSDTITI